MCDVLYEIVCVNSGQQCWQCGLVLCSEFRHFCTARVVDISVLVCEPALQIFLGKR